MREILGDELWSKQEEILYSVAENERTAARSCHGIGKSFTASRVALWFLYNFPYSIVITTAPTFRQVQKITWQELRKAWKFAKLPLTGKLLDTGLNVDEKWYALGMTANDPDHFQGIHADHVLIILEEACGMEADIWTAVDGCLTGSHCRLLSIGNPTDPVCDFAQEFKTPGVSKIKVSAFDTPNFQGKGIVMPALITPAWVEDKRRRWGEKSPRYVSRVLAEFPEQSDDTLIPIGWVEAAAARELSAEVGGPGTLGVDVARYGSDKTTMYHHRGGTLRLHKETEKQGLMETVGHVVQAIQTLKVKSVRIDDAGLGGGVTDRLIELQETGRIDSSVKIYGINVGVTQGVDADYINWRAQLAWNMRCMFESKSIDIAQEDEDLQSELTSVKYTMLSSGKIQLESKKHMKERGLHSPDHFDGAMLAVAPEHLLQQFELGSVEVW